MTDVLEAPTRIAPHAPDRRGFRSSAAEVAGGDGERDIGLSPLVVIGLAFVLGIIVARWLDWMDRARAGL